VAFRVTITGSSVHATVIIQSLESRPAGWSSARACSNVVGAVMAACAGSFRFERWASLLRSSDPWCPGKGSAHALAKSLRHSWNGPDLPGVREVRRAALLPLLPGRRYYALLACCPTQVEEGA
jgi:hypothetical protein